jgi:hypothetical protein
MDIFVEWKFWAALVGMGITWAIIKKLAVSVLKRDTILRKISKVLWGWHKKILHASLVVQYAADVSDLVDKNKIPALVEDNAKRAITLGAAPLPSLDTSHEIEKISSRS